MQNCPACRARYKGESLCARCGADLTLPLLSEQQAEDYLQRAIQLLANDDHASAVAVIQQSLLLKQIPLAAALHAFLKTETHKLAPERVDESEVYESVLVDKPQAHRLLPLKLQDWLSTRKEKWDSFHPDLSLWKKQVLRLQRKGAH